MWPFKKRKPSFYIIEYPLTNNFYAVRKNRGYLKHGNIYFATKCKSKQQAELLIEQYKEQNGFAPVSIYNID